MATSLLSFTLTNLHHHHHHHRHRHLFLSPHFHPHHSHPFVAKPNNPYKPPSRPLPHLANNRRGGADDPISLPDRLISAGCYLYPFLDGIRHGKYLLTQLPILSAPLRPLLPAARLFHSSPLTPFLLFLTLYFAVVRNTDSFSRFVRFNAMQAVVLDVLLIFPDLLESSFQARDGIGLDVLMSMDSTVFLFLLVSLVYGSGSCLLGQVPRLPIVAEAAERQVL